MKIYKVVAGPVLLASGLLKLTEAQASARLHVLRPVNNKDIFELTGETQFKNGEEFGYSGAIPPVLAHMLSTKGGDPVKPTKPSASKPKGSGKKKASGSGAKKSSSPSTSNPDETKPKSPDGGDGKVGANS